jgi:hypothetical protein
MKIVWPWERKKIEQDLDSIEQLLATAFKPVKARPNFISDLRKRLVGSKNPFARVSLSTLELLLLIAGAIASLFAMLFMLIRTIAGIFGRMRLGAAKTRTPGEKKSELVEPKKRTA